MLHQVGLKRCFSDLVQKLQGVITKPWSQISEVNVGHQRDESIIGVGLVVIEFSLEKRTCGPGVENSQKGRADGRFPQYMPNQGLSFQLSIE